MPKYLLPLFFLFACGPLPTSDDPDDPSIEEAFDTDEEALVGAARRGVWIYGPATWIGNTTKVNAFISLMLKTGINEIYLSTNFALLDNPVLPKFIERMSNNGIAVEALIGKVIWGTADGRSDMLRQIDRILDYNRSQLYVRRYRSVHVDIEPWIGTGTDMSWVSPLINSYKAASAALAGTGVKLSADMAGSKAANMTLSQRQAMLNAVNKLVLMQYQTSISNVISRTKRYLSGLTLSGGRGVIPAIRMVDYPFPQPALSSMSTIESSMLSYPGYLGWALYHYDDML